MTRTVTSNLPVNADRIAADIDTLSGITEPDRPYTRRAFSTTYMRGRAYLNDRFQQAGLATRVDAAGNLIGHRPGKKPGKGVIMLGSHSDTVPDGGRFDGIAGVVTALEVARSLQDQGIELDHDLEIVDFLAEEVSIFGVSCIGSRGMTGQRPESWLNRMSGDLSLAQGISQVGGNPAIVTPRNDIAAFLELHIEQGPVLEAEKKDIGVVSAIAGITRIEITFSGQADHAGTTPMDLRVDALCAASRLVMDVQAFGRELAQGPTHFAATVGEFDMQPNAANVVPSHVRLLIDARAEDSAVMEDFCARIDQAAEKLAAETGVGISKPRRISDNPSAPMDETIIETLANASDAVGASWKKMASGAGHDAAFLASVSKAGMVFIPCLKGRSHTPEEWAENHDIAVGAAVLRNAVISLDKSLQE
ncbi:Zn-dependent hydrolase [Thalassospira marina]|uniref:Zn-dependent hydrolase n=1 Tax=Thalassospira marina TaxID=2048283 RepID=A0ABN5FMK2_9PROT|nr:Zn-dependent hydrolase [Thalassospira marina]AUG55367.1 Zn-dependent hydrolase [Thalassospira marina]